MARRDGARKKWLKPTSYSVADGRVARDVAAELAEACWLARTTIASAFQRMIELMRRSIARSPGYCGLAIGGIVLTYAVVGAERQVRAGAARVVDQLLEQEVRALGAFGVDHRLERLEPLAGFLGVYVGSRFHQSVPVFALIPPGFSRRIELRRRSLARLHSPIGLHFARIHGI